jgi:hypothetical protein
MIAVASHTVEGHVSRGFEAVREVFEQNFAQRGELGGACCIYVHGRRGRGPLGRRHNRRCEPWGPTPWWSSLGHEASPR